MPEQRKEKRMSRESKRNFSIAGVLLLFFVLFTIAVLKVDVQAIGPKNSSVGLASVNGFLFEKLGEHAFFDTLTDLLLAVAFLIVFAFFVIGLKQRIQRKSLWKIDNGILALALFYVLVAAFYVLFEIVIVNYRPVLEDGELAASYPSSHTMLVCCIVGSALIQLHRMLKENKATRVFIEVLGIVLILTAIIGRMLSGVHWFTDVSGGALLSAALVMLYYAAVVFMDEQTDFFCAKFCKK